MSLNISGSFVVSNKYFCIFLPLSKTALEYTLMKPARAKNIIANIIDPIKKKNNRHFFLSLAAP